MKLVEEISGAKASVKSIETSEESPGSFKTSKLEIGKERTDFEDS